MKKYHMVKILLMKIFKQLLGIKIRLVNLKDPILNDLRMVLQNMWVRNMLLQFQMELPHYIYAQCFRSWSPVINHYTYYFYCIGKLCSLPWGEKLFFSDIEHTYLLDIIQ
jgi:hypothetical protein